MRRWTLRLLWSVIFISTLPASLRAQDCPYRAATPYNPTVVGRPVPNPVLNMPNFTLDCDIPNQNLEPYVYPPCHMPWDCGGGWGFLGGCRGCGCCDNPCGAILGGCGKGCATGGCSAAIPPAKTDVKPVGNVEPVGLWLWEKKPKYDATKDCMNCPPNGPPRKHQIPRPTALGCASCSTLESEAIFIFGSCRQFFGEPTFGWLHGKQK